MEKRHFDAWGNIVKWVDGNNAPINKGMIGGGVLDRGYTGHEHLFGAGLIHMNGRLYDPVLHRFTMPDNFVQDPYSTLSYNRYSYVMNNPLMYTDSSGEMANCPECGEQPNNGFTESGGGWLGNLIGNIANNWDDHIKPWLDKQVSAVGRWFEKQTNGVGRWFDKQATNLWEKIFGGGGGGGSPQVAYELSVPSNMAQGVPGIMPIFSPAGAGRDFGTSSGESNPGVGYNTTAFEYASFSLLLLADNWTGIGFVDDVLIPVAYTVATGVFIYQNRELLVKQGREMARIVEKALMTPGFQYSLRAVNPGYYPNVRGGTTYLNTGEVWKYGETTQGFACYSETYLEGEGLGLEIVPEHFGPQWEIKLMEKSKIYGYFFTHGTLPPGNRIFR